MLEAQHGRVRLVRVLGEQRVGAVEQRLDCAEFVELKNARAPDREGRMSVRGVRGGCVEGRGGKGRVSVSVRVRVKGKG